MTDAEWYAQEICAELTRQGYSLERAFDWLINTMVDLDEKGAGAYRPLPMLFYAIPDPPVPDIIGDGFGSAWSAWCPECGKKTMQVVRPGKAQCSECG